MLILAGVSINAIVGDDGIISKAQSATYLQSIAELQEFLQMEYSNYALEDNPYGTAYGLLKAKHPGWFYQNAQGYILDSEGHVLYLIKKSGLPEEIQKQVKGGDASKVSQYYKQKDVYGVTSDLQVYYCPNGTSTIMGLTTEDLDKDNPLEIAYDEDSLLSKVVNGVGEDGKALEALSTQDLKSIKTLTIDTTEKLALLQEFKKLPSLQTVYFANITIPTLEGMQYATNITEVRFTNCTVQNYSALCGLSKLNKLYLIKPAGKNTDVATLCSSDKGIATAEFSNLKYFGIVGNDYYLQSTSKNYYGDRFPITDISGLANLSITTKQAIQYMYLQNLQLTSIASLSDYINITILRLEENAITTFNGIQNMSKLAYLIAPTCYSDTTNSYTIGKEETDTQNTSTDALSYIYKNEEGKNTSLYYLDIRNAQNLKWTSYLSSCSGIRYLYMDSNTAIKDISTIASTIGNCGSNYTIPTQCTTEIISSNSYKLDLTGITIKKQDFQKIKNNTNLAYLSLKNTVITENDGTTMTDSNYTAMFNDVLSNCTGMLYLTLYGQLKLTNINFVGNMNALRELDLYNCSNVNDISILETKTNDAIREYNSLLNANGQLIRDISSTEPANFRLGTLIINNSNLELNKIQNTISRLTNYGSFWTKEYVSGFICVNENLLSQLSQCTNITYLKMFAGYNNSYRNQMTAYRNLLDLSHCTNLTSLITYNVGSGFKMPTSLLEYEVSWNESINDFSNCVNLRSISYGDSTRVSKVSAELQTLPNNFESLKKIYMCLGTGCEELGTGVATDFEFFDVLENCRGLEDVTICENHCGGWRDLFVNCPTGFTHLKYCKKIELSFSSKTTNKMILPDLSGLNDLETLKISYGGVYNIDNLSTYNSLKTLKITGGNFNNISSISSLINLTEVELTNDNIRDVSGLKNLNKLVSLDLSNNNINDIEPLENLNKLETLNLQNNALYDSAYDSTGKPYYTLTVFADLNQKQDGKLKNLYLSGNNIEDFSMLQDSNLKWDAKSGW